MRRERKIPTQGSAFCRIIDKFCEWDDTDEVGLAREWEAVLMVYNLAKSKEGFLKPPGFGLPGGGVATDETPLEGMLRELYEETGRVFLKALEEIPWLLESLDSLTKEIESRDENSNYFKMADESRKQVLQQYAEIVERLGLIRLARTENNFSGPAQQTPKPPVWIFEANMDALFPVEKCTDPKRVLTIESPKESPNHCTLMGYLENRANSRNDLAKNTKFSMWICRNQLEEVAGNFKRFADHDQTRVYAGHLRRIDLEVLRTSDR